MPPKKKKAVPKPKPTSKRKYALTVAGLVAAGAVVKALSDSGHIHDWRHGTQQMVIGDDPAPPGAAAVVGQALAPYAVAALTPMIGSTAAADAVGAAGDLAGAPGFSFKHPDHGAVEPALPAPSEPLVGFPTWGVQPTTTGEMVALPMPMNIEPDEYAPQLQAVKEAVVAFKRKRAEQRQRDRLRAAQRKERYDGQDNFDLDARRTKTASKRKRAEQALQRDRQRGAQRTALYDAQDDLDLDSDLPWVSRKNRHDAVPHYNLAGYDGYPTG